jgi:hypothetical protein
LTAVTVDPPSVTWNCSRLPMFLPVAVSTNEVRVEKATDE